VAAIGSTVGDTFTNLFTKAQTAVGGGS
jgi:hypothetical protein